MGKRICWDTPKGKQGKRAYILMKERTFGENQRNPFSKVPANALTESGVSGGGA